MKILRKRVGSFFINGTEEDYHIKEDSIIKNDEIIFNYLPIKNLTFFSLNIKKSSIENKCWVNLDLNLNKLYEFLNDGNTLIYRQTIFEMISCTYNKNIKSNFCKLFDNIKKRKLDKIKKEDFNKKMKIYDKQFVKFGKIFFDLENKLLTITKCKLKTIKIPNYIILNNLYEISIYNSLLNINDNDTLVIISKKNESILEKLFRKNDGTNYINFNSVVYSEDLNYQMYNYSKNLISNTNTNFINQLNLESKKFFYNKKNIFILCKNLNHVSYNYLVNCDFDNMFMIDSLDIKSNMDILLSSYNNYHTEYKQNNILSSEFILYNNIFKLDITDNIQLIKYELYEFPLENWKTITDIHLLDLYKKNKLISNFIKIGKKNNWDNESMNNLENIQSKNNILSNEQYDNNEKCPISMEPLNSFSIKTECDHRFNLNTILEWLNEDKEECPICRNTININNFEFNYIPNFNRFIEQIKDNKNWIIVVDDLWNHHVSFSKFKGKVIKQHELSKKSISHSIYNKLLSSEYYILNLTSINNNDINFMLGISNEITSKFIVLFEKIEK
jgi:hypothetical protein